MSLLSRGLSIGTAMLSVANAAYLEFPVFDTNDRPMDGFKDGLPVYVKAQLQGEESKELEQFLLCTSCSISYIFGDYLESTISAPKATEMMQFRPDA